MQFGNKANGKGPIKQMEGIKCAAEMQQTKNNKFIKIKFYLFFKLTKYKNKSNSILKNVYAPADSLMSRNSLALYSLSMSLTACFISPVQIAPFSHPQFAYPNFLCPRPAFLCLRCRAVRWRSERPFFGPARSKESLHLQLSIIKSFACLGLPVQKCPIRAIPSVRRCQTVPL